VKASFAGEVAVVVNVDEDGAAVNQDFPRLFGRQPQQPRAAFPPRAARNAVLHFCFAPADETRLETLGVVFEPPDAVLVTVRGSVMRLIP